MHIFKHSTASEQQEILASFGLTERDVEQPTQEQQIPWHCGWCQPFTDGATTGICPSCESKYFPRKHRGTRS